MEILSGDITELKSNPKHSNLVMSTGAVWQKFVSSFQPEKNRQALGGNATSNDLPDSSSVRRNGKDSVCSPYKVPLRSTLEWRKGTRGHRARQAQGIAFRLQRDSPRAQIFPNPYASAFCYHLEKKALAFPSGNKKAERLNIHCRSFNRDNRQIALCMCT